MKPITSLLSKNERMALARLYETNDFKILVKYIEALRVSAAKHALDAQNFEEVKHLQGQAHGLKMFVKNLKENHKLSVKD